MITLYHPTIPGVTTTADKKDLAQFKKAGWLDKQPKQTAQPQTADSE